MLFVILFPEQAHIPMTPAWCSGCCKRRWFQCWLRAKILASWVPVLAARQQLFVSAGVAAVDLEVGVGVTATAHLQHEALLALAPGKVSAGSIRSSHA